MLQVRKVCTEDLSTLQRLARECPPLETHTQYTYWVCVNYYAESSFILEKDGEPIGYIMAVDSPKDVFLWQIGIIPRFRSTGLSSMLVEACFEYAKCVGKNIELTISEDNVACYRAMKNFCRVHELPFLYCDDAIVLDADGTEFERERRYRIMVCS